MEQIKQYREENGLTQVQLAGQLGVAQATIHLYEKGERAPGREVSYKLHQMDPERFSLDVLLCPECSSEAA